MAGTYSNDTAKDFLAGMIARLNPISGSDNVTTIPTGVRVGIVPSSSGHNDNPYLLAFDDTALDAAINQPTYITNVEAIEKMGDQFSKLSRANASRIAILISNDDSKVTKQMKNKLRKALNEYDIELYVFGGNDLTTIVQRIRPHRTSVSVYEVPDDGYYLGKKVMIDLAMNKICAGEYLLSRVGCLPLMCR